MLKALELVGFKSFAEKTRFEFPAGITVIVGPNGSGKSNIVDSMKWVLGEQSAKSLRGKDMADVIFKGGGSGGRKPMNTAEATLVFDNSNRDLLYDADEVHVTRRVYRSGEGEYLINGQACRLRDIKDLFRGTGVGTDAYSIIEQGKLDVLLQASARERRAIFEEAAGISRFKAKKVEAQRRLERVDQNMLRLSDIVEEVDNRLRTVRSQAVKAQRYKEYSERLQQLRTRIGQSDWRRLSEKLVSLETELAQVEEEIAAATAELEQAERSAGEWDARMDHLAQAIRDGQIEGGRIREKIVSLESAAENQRARQGDFDRETARLDQQLAEMRVRAGDLSDRLRQVRGDLQHAEAEHRDVAERLTESETALGAWEAEHQRAAEQAQELRRLHQECVRATAELARRARDAETRLATAEASSERAARQVEMLAETLENQASLAATLHQEAEQKSAAVREADLAADAAQAAADETQRALAARRHDLAELEGRRSGAHERATLLEEWELRQEGVSAGAQEVLARAKADPDGPFGDVCGLVADLIEVNVPTAPLIDVALGELAQYIVVKGDRLIEHFAERRERLTGRVGILPLPSAAQTRQFTHLELDGRPGVIGRADLMVETSPWFLPLVRRLLGATWFVEKLAHALALRRDGVLGARFVTLAGELIEQDGTFVVGPPRTAVGIISRRSELRALREQIAAWDAEIAEQHAEIDRLQDELSQQSHRWRELQIRQRDANAAFIEQRALAQSAQQQYEQLARQRETADAELQASQQQRVKSETELEATRQQLLAEEERGETLQCELHTLDQQLAEFEAQRRDRMNAAAAAQVEFAKSEQRLESLRRQLVQFERDQEERDQVLDQMRAQRDQYLNQRREADRLILRSSSELALLYLESETVERRLAELSRQRTDLQDERQQVAASCQKLRADVRKREERRRQAELAAGEVRHERNTLIERLREDYGVEAADLDREPTEEEERQRNEIDEEIAQLRRKINNIGAVNLDALAEVEDLEQRFGKLAGQYQDLCNAKDALEKIITRINADSRRLFAETLDTIRQNFQEVFRKVFGGGRADIVLEEGVDILEAGIEIVATPPGKQSLSISLLSGGERALTAVALMLAIFQFRPSPFCILDEVDGPLDEANIGRFVDQLKEYLAWTKFVIVTHSKKTMTAATTLYGVTMQESGVSKRVSVRFDDVTETGHIRQEAIEREDRAAPPAEDERAA